METIIIILAKHGGTKRFKYNCKITIEQTTDRYLGLLFSTPVVLPLKKGIKTKQAPYA